MRLTCVAFADELGIRIGIHSGQCIAGVIAGEKSRFQVFGETRNVAMALEVTSMKNKIQISKSTADLLREAGMANLLSPRENLVYCKGWGEIQTFWVVGCPKQESTNPKSHAESGHSHEVTDDTEDLRQESKSLGLDESKSDIWENGDFVLLDPPRTFENEKLSRLIDWHVECMIRLLKQIVASRGRECINYHFTRANLAACIESTTNNGTILQELKEVIALPKFDPELLKKVADPESILLDGVVVSQLRDYVTKIALLYRPNPFHNFEHASHVTMAVHKFLARIVTPDDIDYGRKNVSEIASDLHDYTFGIISDPLTHFAILFSALVHDVDHRGISNAQLAREKPEISQLYMNQSIAEQHSVRLAWNLLMEPCYIDLQRCIFRNQTELLRFRQIVVNSVLATDMLDVESKALRNLRWDKAFHPERHHPKPSLDGTSIDGLQGVESLKLIETNRRATVVIEHLIQAADIVHAMQCWQVYKEWNERQFHEMYIAYQAGRSDSDPCVCWYINEMSFFNDFVIPLAEKLEECGVFGVASDECLLNAIENRREWEAKGKFIAAEMVSKCKKLHPVVAPARASLLHENLDKQD